MSTSLGISGANDDVGTYVAVPLTSEDLILALAKLGSSTRKVYESMNKLNLVKTFFRAIEQHAPSSNSVETLSTFIQTFMQPYLNKGAELWGVKYLDENFDQG